MHRCRVLRRARRDALAAAPQGHILWVEGARGGLARRRIVAWPLELAVDEVEANATQSYNGVAEDGPADGFDIVN